MSNCSDRILIASEHFDYHASSVAWGLERLGAQVQNWCIPDFTTTQTISAYPGRDRKFVIRGPDIDVGMADFKTVWIRRGICPVIPASVSELDISYALQESKTLLSGVLAQFSQDAFAVNPLDARQTYGNKIRQLSLAKKIGFEIPDTLVSNSPADIKDFYDLHRGKLIFKPLSYANWLFDGGSAGIYTSRIERQHLDDSAALQACPGIFQPEIQKSYELRVTVMGRSIFAAELATQTEKISLDWRVDFNGNPPCRPYKLPSEIEQKIHLFMKTSGLVFGCFDFIVDKSGQYIFLEVNEMGQFLWLDFAITRFRQFDAFCNFLLKASPDFEYEEGYDPLTVQQFHNYYIENKETYDRLEKDHVPAANTMSIIESDRITSRMIK